MLYIIMMESLDSLGYNTEYSVCEGNSTFGEKHPTLGCHTLYLRVSTFSVWWAA